MGRPGRVDDCGWDEMAPRICAHRTTGKRGLTRVRHDRVYSAPRRTPFTFQEPLMRSLAVTLSVCPFLLAVTVASCGDDNQTATSSAAAAASSGSGTSSSGTGGSGGGSGGPLLDG